jgi:hypothetical protein
MSIQRRELDKKDEDRAQERAAKAKKAAEEDKEARGLARMVIQSDLAEIKGDNWEPRKRDKARNLGLARNAKKRELQDLALTKPSEFYEARNDEFAEMELIVLNLYEDLFQKYLDKQYSEDDANDRAEKVAKSLMGVFTNIIEEDYGGIANKTAASRKAIQSAAATIGAGGMQL